MEDFVDQSHSGGEFEYMRTTLEVSKEIFNFFMHFTVLRPPVFEKLYQLGKFSKVICKCLGKNETEAVQNYKASYQESYI